ALGQPLPLLPLQILWINIATDSLPALALGQSPASPNIMKEKPHPKKENIFKKFHTFIFTATIIQTFANIIIYFYGTHLDKLLNVVTSDLSAHSHARTMVFTQIVLFELLFAFVCKEEKSLSIKSFFSNKSLIGAVIISFGLQLFMIYAPFMQTVFKTVPLSPMEWLIVIVFACAAFIVPITTNTIRKIFKK
ncbi:MAG: cation-translocating P-type ATPase C-terminal domain-containing protein, partial [Candidatus Peregrinibacteria bacterium]